MQQRLTNSYHSAVIVRLPISAVIFGMLSLKCLARQLMLQCRVLVLYSPMLTKPIVLPSNFSAPTNLLENILYRQRMAAIFLSSASGFQMKKLHGYKSHTKDHSAANKLISVRMARLTSW